MGIADHDRPVEKSGVVNPGGAGHFAVAVEREPGGEDGVSGGFAARENGGDSGARRAFADYKFSLAGEERGVADLDSFDVSDGIVGAGSAVERDAEVAGARAGLSGRLSC